MTTTPAHDIAALSRYVAEANPWVKGKRIVDPIGDVWYDIPNFGDSVDLLLAVCERRGWKCGISNFYEGGWFCVMTPDDAEDSDYTATADTAQHAMLIALVQALRAMEGEQ